MPVRSKLPSIIHSGSTVNAASLTAFTYYEVYAGTGGGAATINGTHISMPAGSDLSMVVRTVSDVTGNLYFMGDKINVSDGSTYMGGSYARGA